MTTTRNTMLCMASSADGEPCGQPAAVFDADYSRVVCLAHATHFTEEQRALIDGVLHSLATSLGPNLIGKPG